MRYLLSLTALLLMANPWALGHGRAESAEPTGVWNVRTFGTIGDGETKDTLAVQKAVDSASQAGGGVVMFPPGKYLCGTINLRSGIRLRLDKNAVLLGSTELADYPHHEPPVPATELEFGRRALVLAEGVHDVGIEGEGVIDGRGGDDNFSIRKNRAKGMGEVESVYCRPFLLAFTRCANVRVKGVTLRNSAYWTQDYLDCDNVQIDGLTVRCTANANNDGIDIDGSRNVKVANCDIICGDDGICLKASYKDCNGVTVENCTVSSDCNGIKCGTSSIGGYKNITIRNCTVRDTRLGGLALEIVDGGTMSGIDVQGITISNVGSPLFIRLGDRKRHWVEVKDPLPIGKIENIVIRDVVAEHCGRNRNKKYAPMAASITGLPGHRLSGITLRNIRLGYLGGGGSELAAINVTKIPEAPQGYPEYDMFGDLPCFGLFCRHVDGLTLQGVEFTCEKPEARPAFLADDVDHLELKGVLDRGHAVSVP